MRPSLPRSSSSISFAFAVIRQPMSVHKKIVRVLLVVLAVPLLGILVWCFVLQPLKYQYLIWRVESARTAAQEMAAFRIAAGWGRVWEVNRLRPEDVDTSGHKMTGDWLLQLEWLPSSPFSGRAYVAYRAVTDTNNLRILWDKKY
jgi:hypothetical protein